MISEEEIIVGCIKEIPEAQELLYTIYGPIMKGICIRYIKNREVASDILQDSFIKALKNIKHFKRNGPLKSWMCRIAVNSSLDYLRKQKTIIFKSIEENDEIINEYHHEENDESIVEKMLNKGFTKETLIEIIQKLPDKYSTAFNMFYIDEMPHREIAEVLNINESISRKWVFRAKEMIQKELINYLNNN